MDNNKIFKLLLNLGLCTEESISDYFPRVRDREDVKVLKCNRSGVIFLSASDHIGMSDYSEKKSFEYWGAEDRRAAIMSCIEDSNRRFENFRYLIANRKWIDIGTGAGGILDLLSPLAAQTVAVEPQEEARKALIDLGYSVYSEVKDVKEEGFQVASLFHVFEHLFDPIETLLEIKSKMAVGGKIIIEVPHANDLLISFFNSDNFKNFTFWSEHLILHTRESLQRFLSAAGFKNIVVKGYQRYPLANHFY